MRFSDIREAFSLPLRIVLTITAVLTIFVSYVLFLPPAGFPSGHLIVIPEDALVSEMGEILADRGAIRSAFAFKVYTRLTFQDRSLTNGPYVFDHPIGLAPLVHRLATSDHGLVTARVTFTEGMTVADMGRTLESALPDFDTDGFLNLASTSEGFLFPDTYFFIPGTEPQEVVDRLRARFDERISTIQDVISASGRDLNDLVIMASIIEREAKTEEDMRIISGILWDRLESDMPLQVDAPFGYIHDENGYMPTARDLETDSPYNTYLNKGLPAGAISNPGLTALLAAATPEATPYVYYLTGRDGLMRYARTFEEHKRNRALYLD